MEERLLITNILFDIIYNKKYIHNVLNDSLYNNTNINYSLIKKEVNGVLENKILIEYLINKYSTTKLKSIDKKIHIILLSAIYELIFLDNIKIYATINEYVKIAKKSKGAFLSKFVNAILRKISSNEKLVDILNDSKIDINIKYSIPTELYNYINQNINNNDKNFDTANLIKYYNDNKYLYIRINNINKLDYILKEFDDNNIKYKKYDGSLLLSNTIVYQIENIDSLNKLTSIKYSYISIQDISSIYYIDKLYDVIKTLNNKTLNIVDSCASPGGKTIALYNLLLNNNYFDKINIYSFDKTVYKKQLIDNNIKNFDNKHISIITDVQDATEYNEKYQNLFDVVLLDLPCSGLGIISKKPDIKYNFDKVKIKDLILLQKQIIDNNIKYLNNNSILAISTCTITKNENIDNIQYVIDNNKNIKLLYEEQIISNENNKSDGFYFAILKKDE